MVGITGEDPMKQMCFMGVKELSHTYPHTWFPGDSVAEDSVLFALTGSAFKPSQSPTKQGFIGQQGYLPEGESVGRVHLSLRGKRPY